MSPAQRLSHLPGAALHPIYSLSVWRSHPISNPSAPSTIPEGFQRLTWDLVLEGALALPLLVSEDVPTIGDQVGHPLQVRTLPSKIPCTAHLDVVEILPIKSWHEVIRHLYWEVIWKIVNQLGG